LSRRELFDLGFRGWPDQNVKARRLEIIEDPGSSLTNLPDKVVGRDGSKQAYAERKGPDFLENGSRFRGTPGLAGN
jgi:hypothetical protein